MLENTELIQAIQNVISDPEHAQVYLLLLQLGPQPISVIAQKMQTPRTTLYYTMAQMTEAGLTLEIPDQGGKKYQAIHPEKLRERKELEINNQFQTEKNKLNEYLEILPDLNKIKQIGLTQPHTTIHYGPNALKELYEQSLHASRIWAYYEPNALINNQRLADIGDWHTKERIKRKIPGKIIVPNTKMGRLYVSQKNKYKETKLVDQCLLPFKGVTMISENELMIYSHEEEIGIIITSSYIAQNQIAIFEYAWQATK